jgi:hypothetical protein
MATAGYRRYQWHVDDEEKGNAMTLELDAADYSLGAHSLEVIFSKNGKDASGIRRLVFKVIGQDSPADQAALYIVACGIFAPELEKILPALRRDLPEIRIETLFLPPALHNSYEEMEKGVKQALEKLEGQKILLLYGSKCHPNMTAIAGDSGAVCPEEANCIEILTGAEKKTALDQGEKIFYLSAGWLRHWHDIFDRRFGWDLVEMWFELGGITKIVVLDDGYGEFSEATRLEFFSKLHVPVEVEMITLDHFADTTTALCRSCLSG